MTDYLDESLGYVANAVSITTKWTGDSSRGIGALEQRLSKVEERYDLPSQERRFQY